MKQQEAGTYEDKNFLNQKLIQTYLLTRGVTVLGFPSWTGSAAVCGPCFWKDSRWSTVYVYKSFLAPWRYFLNRKQSCWVKSLSASPHQTCRNDLMACDHHVGNLIQLITVKSKSPAQQKPPSSSHLLKRLWWGWLCFFLFCCQAFRAGFLFKGSQELDSSPGQKLHHYWNNEPYASPPPMRVKRAHAFTQTYSITSTHSFIWVLRQMHIFYTAQCLKWSPSRDVRHPFLLPSAMSLSATYCPEMSKRKEKKKQNKSFPHKLAET